MGLSEKNCIPCKGGIPPLTRTEAENLLKEVETWQLSQDSTSIHKRFCLKNFAQAMAFGVKVGDCAEREGHHPVLTIGWGFCTVTLSTKKIKGLHENDFIMAAKIDALAEIKE